MSYSQLSWREGWLVAVLVATTACGGATSDDTSDSMSYGGSPPMNTSNLQGGTWTMNTPNLVGGAGTMNTSNMADGGRTVSTLGATGGSYSATGGKTSIAGAAGLGTLVYSTAGSSSLPRGGTSSVVGGAQSLGGVAAIGGMYISAGGAVQAGGASATGGSDALGTDLCMLPLQSGDCSPLVENYYFDVAAGRCVPFNYGGCGGNANRFDTLAACQQRCQPDSLCPRVKPPTDPTLQCAVSSVCYYDVSSSCGCKLNYGHCDLIDSSCPYTDAGTDADASTNLGATDAGELGNRAIVCTCGSPGWSCREIAVYEWGID